MLICFTGDLFLGGDLRGMRADGAVRAAAFRGADARISNMEQPISDRQGMADKCTLYTGPFAVTQLQNLRITAVGLANNHIQDKQDEGIFDTLQHLRAGGIACFGAGTGLENARKPYIATPSLAILGYCEFGKPYLRQVQLAGNHKPGVNPLHYSSILEDLDSLPENAEAILLFHWGREHVLLPPPANIRLAKVLLRHERVAGIIGTHAHRVQGYIEEGRKRAYFCLGNFLFPNFFIEPPTRIAYPKSSEKSCKVTRRYHSVDKLTYKKWRLRNRISIVVTFNTETGTFRHTPVIQADNEPIVRDLRGLAATFVCGWIKALSQMYRLPDWAYGPLERLHKVILYFFWNSGIRFFKLRQNGLSWCLRKALCKLRNRLNPTTSSQ